MEYPVGQDTEIIAHYENLHSPQCDSEMRSRTEKEIERRRAAVIEGASQAPEHLNAALRQIDPKLRLRFEFDQPCWVVDRWVASMNGWHPVIFWMDQNGRALPLDGVIDQENPFTHLWHKLSFLDFVRASDLQKRGARQVMADKRAVSDAVKQANAKAAEESVLAAVDSLSTKQIKEFLDVERALQTGETIEARGPMAETLDRMEKATKTQPAARQLAMMPQSHPRRRRHTGAKR
jgi:hypothetical protein